MDSKDYLVATGQVGAQPMIGVWDVKAQQTRAIIKGTLTHGVGKLCISNDGKKIAAIGLDPWHLLVIYDLEKVANSRLNPTKKKNTEGIICQGNTTKSEILDARFDPQDKTVILACVKGLYFVSYDNQQIKVVQGLWGQNQMQATLCIGFIDTNTVTGMFKGELLVWKQNQIFSTTKAHMGSVTCLWTRKSQKGLISGGNDGEVIVWDQNLKRMNQFSLTDQNLKSINYKVRSVCESNNGQNVLVGTRGSEIIEFVNGKSTILMHGHYEGELWGLAISPNSTIYYTVGEENLLAMWDVTQKKQKKSLKLDFPSRTIAVSPDSKYIAVGCLNGHILIIDPKNLNVLTTLKDRQAEVTCIKFSPNSDTLAVAFGVPFNEILLYEVKQNFKISEKKLKGSQTKITHLDFSENGKILQINNEGAELIYYDLKIGKRLPKGGQENKDEQWHQWSCVYGWSVQGIWPPCSSGTDINSVDRSQKLDILVAADNFGKVKMFKYPVASQNAGYNCYRGHSNKVTNVKFSGKNDYILSIGGDDKCIFQWKYSFDTEGFEEAENIQSTVQEEEKRIDDTMEDDDKDADDLGAVKPFKGEVMHSIPSNYKASPSDNQQPSGNLDLKHVFGLRCHDIRNSIKFSGSGKSVYVAASLGIVIEKTKTQTFFQVHEEEIGSLAIHPKGQIAATGSISAKGKPKTIDIYIWDIDTKEIISHLNDFHRKAVTQLAFSPNDGCKLLSIGEDEDHSLAIHDWQTSQLLCTCKVDRSKVTGISWKNDQQFVTVGAKHVKFWTMLGNNLKNKRGLMGQQTGGIFEVLTCVTYAFNNAICVTGSNKGSLTVWQNDAFQKQLKNVHGIGEIGCLLAYKNQMLSGGYDGSVILWQYSSNQLTKTQELFQMATLSKYLPAVKSLDMKQDSTVIIGIRGSEIFEGKLGGGQSSLINLIQGHFEGEIWGLATCPKNYKFVTAGGDKMIRLWDAQLKKMLLTSAEPFEDEIRALDWDVQGKFIVAGDIKAKIHLIDPNTLKPWHSLPSKLQAAVHSKGTAWIQDIKISPNSTLVAFGIHNTASNIEILSVQNTVLQSKVMIQSGLSSALTHLDWSSDSKQIVVNSSAYELKFFSISNIKPISASAAKDIEWHTWTCVLGFPVQGIYVQGPDGQNVNSVCRSLNRKCLITGDDYGKVNLFKFPSVVEKSLCKSYIAHSSKVTNVRYSFDDVYAISVGGNDRCICIWETDFGVEDSSQKKDPSQKIDEDEEKGPQGEQDEVEECAYDDSEFLQKKMRKFGPEKFGKDKLGKKIGNFEGEDIFAEEEQKQAEEFLAIKPWVGAIKEPAGYLKPPLRQELPPQVELSLDYVYGYRVKDCRNNLKYLANGNIVYPAAAIGIVMEIQQNNQSNTQMFFTQHKEDVTAISMHPEGIIIATGELGHKPSIYVWNSNTMQQLCHFSGYLSKGVACLSFSKSGDKLAAVGMDENHEVVIFDVKTNGGTFLSKSRGGRELITAINWKNDSELATCGLKHMAFWTVNNKTLNSRRGNFWKQANNILLAVEYNGEECVTGAYDGHLQVWSNGSMINQHKIHEKSVDALCINMNYILTGSADMTIKILDKTYKVILNYPAQINLKSSLCPMIRSAYLSQDCKNIIIGTIASEIYEIVTKDSKITLNTKFYSPKEILNAHYAPNKKSSNEVWGLAVYQDQDTFATCADDGTLRIWSSSKKKQIKYAKINFDSGMKELAVNATTKDLNDAARGRALAISPDQKHLCIGFKDGHLKVYETDPDPPTQLLNFKCAKDCISCIQYAPSQKMLAIGSHDFAIYLYTVPDYKKKFVMRKHTSFITHLDFSDNSVNLQSNCGGYELLFWDCTSGKQLTNGGAALRDEQWSTYTCTLGWPVQGIHPVCSDGTDINSAQRSHSKHSGGYSLLATGDDYGQVKILRFPSIKKGSQGVVGLGHSSFVTNVQWSANDQYLYSTGGEDGCIFQWKVIKQ